MSANLEAIPKNTKVPPGGTLLFFEDWDEYFLAIAEIIDWNFIKPIGSDDGAIRNCCQ
jgi:hypothetical protein